MAVWNKHIFFNKNSKKVTALVSDICNNKYFDCSFLLLSVPLKQYGDIVDLNCNCDNVPFNDKIDVIVQQVMKLQRIQLVRQVTAETQ